MCYCAKFTNYSTVFQVLQSLTRVLQLPACWEKAKEENERSMFFFLSVHLLLSPDFSLCAGRRETVEWSTAFGEWR